eukprot:TRINITY_DN1192_c0_g1_i1.p1 TRINITY_DN1192_c0_g1~~TRINITY_DN1192_c0_g1_i1.p1  ORF type:complete len:896 (-),score=200.83 TRINITY_DN1192_c0_g1_i1:38-2689(-)
MSARWSIPTTSGPAPSARSGHSFTLVGHKLLLFGGFGHNYFNDIYLFDLRTNTWERLQGSGNVPSARAWHSTTAIDDHVVFVFGGISSGTTTNDSYFLDTDNGHWSIAESASVQPPPRQGHIATLLENKLYIFGGCSATTLNDLWILSFQTMQWTQIPVRGMWPRARYGHAAVAWRGKIVMCGGCGDTWMDDWWIFEPISSKWSKQRLTHGRMLARGWHSLFLVSPENTSFHPKAASEYTDSDNPFTGTQDIIVAIGGAAERTWYNDMVCARPAVGPPNAVDTWKCTIAPVVVGDVPAPRESHTAVVVGDTLWVFGGHNSTARFDTLHRLELVYGVVESEPVEPTISSSNTFTPRATTASNAHSTALSSAMSASSPAGSATRRSHRPDSHAHAHAHAASSPMASPAPSAIASQLSMGTATPDLSSFGKGVSEEVAHQLRKRAEDLEEKLRAEEDAKQQLQKQIQHQQTEYQKLQDMLQQLQHRLKESQHALLQVSSERDEANALLTHERAAREESNSRCDDLLWRLREAEEELLPLQEEIRTLQRERLPLRTHLAEVSVLEEDQQDLMNTSGSETADTSILAPVTAQMLQEQLEVLQKTLADESRQRTIAHTLANALKHELAQARHEQAQQSFENKQLADTVAVLRSSISKFEAEKVVDGDLRKFQLEMQLAPVIAERDLAKQSEEAQRASVRALRREVSTIRAELSVAQMEREKATVQLKSERDELMNAIHQANSVAKEARARATAIETEMNTHVAEAARWKRIAETGAGLDQVDDLKREIAKMQIEGERTADDLRNSESARAVADRDLQHLLEELEDSKQANVSMQRNSPAGRGATRRLGSPLTQKMLRRSSITASPRSPSTPKQGTQLASGTRTDLVTFR